MVSTLRSDDAHFRQLSHQQMCERSSHLERSRMLQVLKLEGQWERLETEVSAVKPEHRRHTDVGAQDRISLLDTRPVNRAHRWCLPRWPFERQPP